MRLILDVCFVIYGSHRGLNFPLMRINTYQQISDQMTRQISTVRDLHINQIECSDTEFGDATLHFPRLTVDLKFLVREHGYKRLIRSEEMIFNTPRLNFYFEPDLLCWQNSLIFPNISIAVPRSSGFNESSCLINGRSSCGVDENGSSFPFSKSARTSNPSLS